MIQTILSIIIPYYNGGSTILNCLDSIYSIDLPANLFEVIVVDDNSPFKAADILREYTINNSNLHVLRHPTNTRQGGAKNTGIRVSEGEYVAFADQDDIIIPQNLLMALNQAIAHKVDILCCHYSVKDENGEVRECGILTGDKLFMTGRDFCENHFNPGFNLAPWANLYRRDYLNMVNHPFEENVLMEDADWIAWHWIHASKVGIWNHSIYYWVMNPKSITHSYHYRNRADYIKFGLRKMRDAKEFEYLSPMFSAVMYRDGYYNILYTFLKIWKIDSYSNFYIHLGDDILEKLQDIEWRVPVSFYVNHPNISCIILNIIGPLLKISNVVFHKCLYIISLLNRDFLRDCK